VAQAIVYFMPESLPIEAFLDGYPPSMRAHAEQLRALVKRVVPDATERLRLGWRLIGFDLPVGRRSVYFAWVAPELEHVHLGFPHGVLVNDPHGRLSGAGITKRARWLTYGARDSIDERVAAELIGAAVTATGIPRGALE
jgi:hypothetical protein